MKRFFQELFQANNDNFFQQHLPNDLYDYIKSHHLLGHKKHQYILEDNVVATIQVTKETTNGDNNATINVVIFDSQQNELLKRMEAFENKSWCASAVIDKDGLDYVSGNKKACPFTGFSDQECKEKTPDIVKELKAVLEKVMNVTPASSVQLRK